MAPYRLFQFLAASAAVCFSAITADAATVTYQNAEPTPKMQLVIDDGVGPNVFRFSLTTLVGTADFLGLGFNFAGTSLAAGDFSLVSATNASNSDITGVTTLSLFGNNTASQSDCGPGCNFNGSGSASSFDYIVRLGSNGGSPNDYLKTVVFDVSTAGDLSVNPFSQLAIRAQSASCCGGSIKSDLTPVNDVPLPAGLGLAASAFAGLLLLRRRRQAAA